jgi:hypothetical protein
VWIGARPPAFNRIPYAWTNIGYDDIVKGYEAVGEKEELVEALRST